MVERLPFGMRTPVAVTYVRCAQCGAMGELVLEDGRLALAMARAGTHVREMHPGANVPEAIRLVSDVVFPPADCADVAEWVAQYNARNGMGWRPAAVIAPELRRVRARGRWGAPGARRRSRPGRRSDHPPFPR